MKAALTIGFNGQCQAAFEFYEAVFNEKVEALFRYSDSPSSSSVPSNWQDKIIHGSINIAGMTLVGSDLLDEQYEQKKGFSILLSIDSHDEVEALFSALSCNGEVIIAPEKTFWSCCYAIVIDQFGIKWQLNCSI